MRGLKTERSLRVIVRSHAVMQNLRRGHYELGVEVASRHLRIAAAFDEHNRENLSMRSESNDQKFATHNNATVPLEVPNRSHDRGGGGDNDPGDRLQPVDHGIVER